MASTTLDMRATAAEVGAHYDTLRKQWKSWVRDKGFPPPYEVQPYKWLSASVDAWKIRREAERRDQVLKEFAADELPAASPANDAAAMLAPSAPRRIERDRDAIMTLMRNRRS